MSSITTSVIYPLFDPVLKTLHNAQLKRTSSLLTRSVSTRGSSMMWGQFKCILSVQLSLAHLRTVLLISCIGEF